MQCAPSENSGIITLSVLIVAAIKADSFFWYSQFSHFSFQYFLLNHVFCQLRTQGFYLVWKAECSVCLVLACEFFFSKSMHWNAQTTWLLQCLFCCLLLSVFKCINWASCSKVSQDLKCFCCQREVKLELLIFILYKQVFPLGAILGSSLLWLLVSLHLYLCCDNWNYWFMES